MPIHKAVNHTFFKTWSRDMAYVLGFFFADGNMICTKRGTHFISFYSNDKCIIDAIRIAIGSNHTVGVQEKPRTGTKNYRLQIGSKGMYADLLTLGARPTKSLTLMFPCIPKKYLADFVRGYFDGDGNVYFKKHVVRDRNNKKRWVFSSRFTSGSREFLVRLHAALQVYGVQKGFIVTKSKASGFELVLSHRDSVALYAFIYHNTVPQELYLTRKYKLFTKAVTTLYGKNAVVAQR